MSQERWDTLSDADKVLLKMLGVTGVSTKKEKRVPNPVTLAAKLSRMNTAPEEEYWLKVTVFCGCCKSAHVVTGRMGRRKETDNFHSLIKCELPPDVPFNQQRKTSTTCHLCDEKLGTMTKEELISHIKLLAEVRNMVS